MNEQARTSLNAIETVATLISGMMPDAARMLRDNVRRLRDTQPTGERTPGGEVHSCPMCGREYVEGSLDPFPL